MSYSGTVYCSWCGNKGHNRAGCVERKQHIAENPDSYAARREAQKARDRKNTPRACSYCRVPGHTRRTCPTIKNDRVLLAKKLTKKRSEMLAMAEFKGFGLGALVNVRKSWEGYHAALVMSIGWAHSDGDYLSTTFQYVEDSLNRRSTNVRLEDMGAVGEISEYRVLSKGEMNAPEDWKNGTMYRDDEYFPKGEARRAWRIED